MTPSMFYYFVFRLFLGIFSRRILEENEPDYYSGKFFFLFFSSDHRMYA